MFVHHQLINTDPSAMVMMVQRLIEIKTGDA